VYLRYLLPGEPADVFQQYAAAQKSAIRLKNDGYVVPDITQPSPANQAAGSKYGFDPVKLNSVYQTMQTKYMKLIYCGMMTTAGWTDLKTQLTNAGWDKYMKWVNADYAAWYKVNGQK
jgi:hypothetical protein